MARFAQRSVADAASGEPSPEAGKSSAVPTINASWQSAETRIPSHLLGLLLAIHLRVFRQVERRRMGCALNVINYLVI
ncbi:hypothetical protein ACUSIJ_18015 [Pseudochelatococcus sp. B33]